MNFGPYNLDYSPRLIIKELEISIDQHITHFWGSNGVGKSTLMDLILKDLVKKKSLFTYLNQNYRQSWLWWYSPKKNLETVLKAKITEETWQTNQFFKEQANWLRPLLENSGKQIDFSKDSELATVNLSGGQLQRLILFRELIRKPKFLLLDEAFSALDKDVYTELIDWLITQQKSQKFQIISIAHNPEVVTRMGGVIYKMKKIANSELKLSKVKEL